MQYDSIWRGFNAATMVGGSFNQITDAAIAVKDGCVSWIGEAAALPSSDAEQSYDLGGGWVTPGLIDCHTHLVFGGDRAWEFERRLQGHSYTEIAASGGGIVASVAATRTQNEQQLLASAQPRLNALMADGVTTVEIKSGYGLDLENELKMLKVARALQLESPITIKTTCLAAHALPTEYSGDAEAYIDFLCDQLLPQVAASGLADAVDAFCENIGFSVAQVDRYFSAARQLGLPVKLHAEQLSALGGASLAARHRALSADHLEYATEADVAAMAKSGTVAVLLPGAFYTLHETQRPPIDLLRQYKVPMAVATDLNPGTSPVLSARLMMNMACTLFGLTPEEALAGTTTHAAAALGMAGSYGELSVGSAADFVCWDVASPAELSYWLGGRLLKQRVQNGRKANVE